MRGELRVFSEFGSEGLEKVEDLIEISSYASPTSTSARDHSRVRLETMRTSLLRTICSEVAHAGAAQGDALHGAGERLPP